MKRFILLKLVGLSVLYMAILIVCSFIEVAIYSYLIIPGKNEAFYEAHSMVSAPYISAIFGFLLFFTTVRFWKKKNYNNVQTLAFLFPAVYFLIDLGLMVGFSVNWAEIWLIFTLSNLAKFIGSMLGFFLPTKPTNNA